MTAQLTLIVTSRSPRATSAAISNSAITQNVTGLSASGGSIVSMSGNSVTGNTADGAFTSTVPKLWSVEPATQFSFEGAVHANSEVRCGVFQL